MKLMIGFLVIAFLLPAFVNAQSTASLGPSCQSNYKSLTIPKIPQKFGTSWCWAAAAQNVMGFHQKKYKPPTTEQCDLVKNVLWAYERKDLPCCSERFNQCMGEGGWPEEIFDLREYQFSYKPSDYSWKKLDWTAATEEICQNRPFISVIDFLFGDPHIVVVHGYRIEDGKREVKVFDPVDDDSEFESFDVFVGQGPDYQHLGDTFEVQP